MRAFVVLTLVAACSSPPAPRAPVEAAPPPAAAATPAPPPLRAWATTSDEVFSIETPIPSAPGTNPHSWAAAINDDLAYLMMYMSVPGAETRLDNLVTTIGSKMKSLDNVETVTILGRPARRIAATTPAGRPAVEVLVADGNRVFMLQVIGATSPDDIEHFLSSFKIR